MSRTECERFCIDWSPFYQRQEVTVKAVIICQFGVEGRPQQLALLHGNDTFYHPGEPAPYAGPDAGDEGARMNTARKGRPARQDGDLKSASKLSTWRPKALRSPVRRARR